MSPAPYSKLQRRRPLFLIRAYKNLMLLFLRDFNNRYGCASSRNIGHENIMLPFCEIRAFRGHKFFSFSGRRGGRPYGLKTSVSFNAKIVPLSAR